MKYQITVPDDLEQRLQAYVAAQTVAPSRSAVHVVALREFLDKKGVK